jgi:hypothetical protein
MFRENPTNLSLSEISNNTEVEAKKFDAMNQKINA